MLAPVVEGWGVKVRRVASEGMLLQVHERTLQGDFLMALLKDILAARRAAGRPLKVHSIGP